MSIDEEYRSIDMRALQWIVYSINDLNVEELAEAARISPETNETPINHDTKIIQPDRVIEILSSLVISTPPELSYDHIPNIALAHFSVKE